VSGADRYEDAEITLKLCFALVPKQRKEGETLKRPESFDTKDKPRWLSSSSAKRRMGEARRRPPAVTLQVRNFPA
jgi:hypothetical protein